MKKILSLILASAIVSPLVPTAFAQEDYQKLIPEIKNRVNMPEEYSEFEYNGRYETDGKLRYSFMWTKEKDNKKDYIMIETYSDGSILSYDKRDEAERFDYLQTDINEAEKIAYNFISVTNPSLECQLRFETSEYSYGALSFDIFAVFDGVEYYRAVGSVKVSDDYEVVSMNINIPEIAEPENKEFISHSDGYNNYMDKIGVKTTYKTYTDTESKKIVAFPAYTLNSVKAIDAVTGEVIETGSDRIMYANSTALKEEAAADTAGGYSELTESEKKKIEEVEKLVSKETVAGNMKKRLGITPSMETVYFNKNYMGEYSYTFYEDDYSAKINAHNGDINWFSSYSEDKEKFFEIKNENDATALIKKLAPTDGIKYKPDTETDSYEKDNTSVSFFYEHNGITVEGANARINDTYFSITPLKLYEEAEYVSKDEFKPINEIFGDVETVKLRYIDTKDGVKAGYIADSVTVNARTGKRVDNRNEEIKENKYTYSDLDSHWVKEAAEKLALAKIGFEGGVFSPEKAVTKAEVLPFLDEISYDHSEDAETDSVLSRKQFADMLCKRLGYGEIIPYDIFIKPYEDVTENYGSVALLKAMSVLDSDTDNFRPDENLTRAEMVAMIYRTLVNNK